MIKIRNRNVRRAYSAVTLLPVAVILAIVFGTVGAFSGVASAVSHALDIWSE
jgi:hypothetical protein